MNIRAKLRDPFGRVTADGLLEFERAIDAKLPPEYRDFLLHQNGGVYHDYVDGPWHFGTSVVFGVDAGASWADLLDTWHVTRQWMDPELLPFASDAGGDYACVSLGSDFGAVYTVDHEQMFGARVVAASVIDFLDATVLSRDWLAEHDRSGDPFRSVMFDDIEKLRAELSTGLAPDHCDSDGTTLLMRSAHRCRLEIIGQLLSAGARMDLRNKRGRSAITFATITHSPDCIQLLAENGADVNETDGTGASLLILAAGHGDERCVSRLIELGADIHYVAPNGATALSSCFNNTEAIQRILRLAGANGGAGPT